MQKKTNKVTKKQMVKKPQAKTTAQRAKPTAKESLTSLLELFGNISF